MAQFPCTLRVTGLPHGTKREDIAKHFSDRLRQTSAHDFNIGPICPHDHDSSTIVTFASPELAEKAHMLEAPSRNLSTRTAGRGTLKIDTHFGLFTTLYYSNNPQTAKPDIDIVVVHDLHGHPWYSFAQTISSSQGGHGCKEENWLKDLLPNLLEQNSTQGVHARILTFGYRPDLWITQSLEKVKDTENSLFRGLQSQRSTDPSRPLFVIAHGLGGVLAKQLFIDLANQSLIASEPSSLLGGCIFLGVPNQVNEAGSILQNFHIAYNKNGNLEEEDRKATHIANSANEFSTIRDLHNLDILCFVAAERYNSIMVVEPESGTFNYAQHPNMCILNRKNHLTMARFSSAESELLKPAVSFICQSVKNAVELQYLRQAEPGTNDASFWRNQPGSEEEDEFLLLKDYDTVFLVDDSSSMHTARRWELVQRILAVSTEIATHYDPDGIDIRFFNNRAASAKNIKDPNVAREKVQAVTPYGRTPTLRRMSDLLRPYIRHLFDNRDDENFHKLNLIILTDGEPDRDFEEPRDISDAEDAKKNSAANRKIRKEIVSTAKQLDDMHASDEQVGIQFCQIGNDTGVTGFFEYLDNNLRNKHGVRDIVDTVRCIDERDLTPAFYLKLLTGSIDRYADNKAQDLEHAQGQSNHNQDSTHRPHQPHHSSQNSNESESSTRTWNPSRVLTASTTNSDHMDLIANHFQGFHISDQNYNYSPSPPAAAATPVRFASARGAQSQSRVQPRPAANQYAAAQVEDPYSYHEPPRAQTLPSAAPGSSSAAPAQPKQAAKKRFSLFSHHHRDAKS